MLARFLIYYRIFLLLICSTVTQASSLTESSSLSWKQTEFLPAEQAFPYEVELSQTQRPELSAHPLQKIQLQWHITEDYYLYQQAFNLASPMQDAKVFGPFFDREAENKFDPNFNKDMAIFKRQILVDFYIENPSSENNLPTHFTLTFQGCAEAGLCYPLQEKVIANTSSKNRFINSGNTYASLSDKVLPGQQLNDLLQNASLLKIFLI